jgi:hypothetical protein
MADSRKYSDSIFQKNDSRISSTDATAFSSIGQNAVFKDGQHNDPPMSEDVIMFDDTSTASANVDSSIVGVKRVSECSDNSSKSAAKKQKTRPIGIAKNFQGDKKKKDGAQARAMAYAQETNGVIFGRDHGNAKQYYVSPDKDHMYNFIFGLYKKKRDFYEWIPQNTPVRLYLDLEIERVKVDKKTNKELYRYESRDDLFAAINEAEKEVTRVVVEQLKEQHDVQVDESQILSLNSDGIDKGSRHVIFPVWFDDNGTSMDSFVHSILGLLSTDVGQRATDKGVYSKHRVFRFFGNTKVGQSRWLHLPSQPDLKPFTPEHRAIFDASLVEAPPPDGVVPIHIEQAKVMNKTASTGIRAHFGGVSDTHPRLDNDFVDGSYMENLKTYVLHTYMTDCTTNVSIKKTIITANGCVELLTGSKLCWNKGACHKSNHVNYIAGRCGIRQSCFDGDCSKTEWKAWPSPRPDFVNRLFFARPPQKEIKGKRVPPSRSHVFFDWTMTSQRIDPENNLSGDVVPDYFYNAPFDLYAKDIYGFLKLREMFSCGSDGDYLPTIPNEFLELAKKHSDWLNTMKRALTSRGQETYFVVMCLDEEGKDKPKKQSYMYLFRTNPTADVFVDALKKWREDEDNKPKLQVFEMFRTAPLNAMLDYYAEIKERLVQQVNPLTSPVGREKRRLYDVLISAGVDVQFGAVLEDDMLLKLLLHIVDEDRWARQTVTTFDKQSGRLECPVLKYNQKTRVYDKRFDCLNDFCIHVLCKLRVDTDYCASKYLASNPRVMSVLLRSLEQKWAPLQPDRRYVAFKDGIYDRFCEQDDGELLMGRFFPDDSEEYQAVVNNTEQDIYRFFDIPYGASPTDTWIVEDTGSKTVAAMKPKYTGEAATVIDKILQYQGLSDEDCFVIWAAAGRSMLGLMHEEKRIDGLKLSLYFDGESDTGKTIVLDILSHAHPDEQIGAFSEEKSFPMATAVHRGILVNHESNQMIVPFTIWRNVCEGVDVAAAIKYSAAFYGCINAMIVGAGNGVCTNYPDTGGAKSARLCRVPMPRIVGKKDSTLLDQAKNSYGVIMHKAISAYWTWLQCCVKKGTWYASLSKESVLYGREAKSRHHLLERFIAERMKVIGFKDRVKETLKFRGGVPNIKLEHQRTAPKSAPDSEPRVALQDFVDLYYKWIVELSEGDDFENPYVSKGDCIQKCFNPEDKKLNYNLGQNFFWNKYHCVMKKVKLGSETKSSHVVYGMHEKQGVLYPMPIQSSGESDKLKALVAVKRNGLLENVSVELQGDKEVVLAAVKRRGNALEYASLELRDDVEIVKVAIDNWPGSVYFASERVKKLLN